MRSAAVGALTHCVAVLRVVDGEHNGAQELALDRVEHALLDPAGDLRRADRERPVVQATG